MSSPETSIVSRKSGKTFLSFRMKENMPFIWLSTVIAKQSQGISTFNANTINPVIIHNRHGHASHQALSKCQTACKGFLTKYVQPSTVKICQGCTYGGTTKAIYTQSKKRSTEKLQLLHMDLIKFPVQSYNHYKYALNVCDDHTSFAWSFNQKTKTELETLNNFEFLHKLVERETGKKLLAIHTDHSEFFGAAFCNYLKEHGI